MIHNTMEPEEADRILAKCDARNRVGAVVLLWIFALFFLFTWHPFACVLAALAGGLYAAVPELSGAKNGQA